MSSKNQQQADEEQPERGVFDTIEDPRAHFENSYSKAFDEVVWRGFRILFERGRIENATTRELNMLVGTSVDKIQDLSVTALPEDSAKHLERHRWAEDKLQELMRSYGLTRQEALDVLRKDAPSVYQLIVQRPTQNDSGYAPGGQPSSKVM